MDDVKALIESLLKDIKDVDKKKIKRKVETDKVKANINIDFGEKSDGYYVSKLRLTTNLLDVPSQVKSQSLKLYIRFARLIDKKSDILKTSYLYNQLYVLARDYVEDFIDPYHEKKEARIYKNLAGITKKNLKPLLKVQAEEFLDDFPDLSAEVIDFYKLTANGKLVVFWDEDGILREKYKFKKNEERALLDLGQRRNVLWRSEGLSDLTINLFLKSMKLVFSRDNIKTDIIKEYTRPYTLSKNIIDSLLIITEANVRSYFSFLAEIKTQKALDTLLENNCDDILRFFMEYQLAYLDNLEDSVTEEIYLAYLKENPQKSNDIAKFIASLNLDRQGPMLKTFSHRENFSEILSNLSKNDFVPTKILALYYIFNENMASKRDKKVLFDLIREDNYQEFLDLISKKDFDINLVAEVLDLRKVRAKKISLNKNLVKKSRKDLSKTVATINEFVGEEDPAENTTSEEGIKPREDKDKKTNNLSNEARKVVGKIIEDGYISADQASELALAEGLFLNVFINNINDELFEYTNDQTLVIDDGRVFIDEFYVEMIKELIDG